MSHPILIKAMEILERGIPVALVIVTQVDGSAPRKPGARMLVWGDLQIEGTIGGGAFERKLMQEAMSALREKQPRSVHLNLTHDLGMCCGGRMTAFVDVWEPKDHLVIWGAGHVGTEVAILAHRVGMKVTVVDERVDWADTHRFPEGVTCLLGDPLFLFERVPLGETTFHLVTTHAHSLDQDLVLRLLERNVRWLGMIGSTAKRARFRTRLLGAGVPEEKVAALRTPVGVDIGAQTPAEIAVSILADIIQTRRCQSFATTDVTTSTN